MDGQSFAKIVGTIAERSAGYWFGSGMNLKKLPFEDLGFAKIDNHRVLRTGVPEVIFCQVEKPFSRFKLSSRGSPSTTTISWQHGPVLRPSRHSARLLD